MPRVPVQKTTFGKLEPGDHFVLSATDAAPKSKHDHAIEEGAILNVKLRNEARVVDEPGEHRPFNVVCLEDGRPRTFSEEETVYKTDGDGCLEAPTRPRDKSA